ncbi:hypothetical protein ABTM49_20140, partial [Acinetobacter baumannii]
KKGSTGLIGTGFQSANQPPSGYGAVDSGSGRGEIVIDYATFLQRQDELLSSGLLDPSGLSGQASASMTSDTVGLGVTDAPGGKGGPG